MRNARSSRNATKILLTSRMFRKLNRFNLEGSCIKVEVSQGVKVQKFFIGNLAREAKEEEIAEFFESYGVKVRSAVTSREGNLK